MSLEIAANKRVGFAVHCFDVLEPSGARDLLDKDAVKFWVNAVGFNHDGNELARRDFERACRHFDHGVAHYLHHFVHVTVDHSRDQRLLAREILVQRTNTHARHGGDLVGARPIVAFFHQNASSRFEERIDGKP
jgi:hypothetical protein